MIFFFSERIRRTPGVTAVFVNVERLSPASEVRVGDESFTHALQCRLSLYCPIDLSQYGIWLHRLDSDSIFSFQKEFEEAWGVKVFDRYSVVLHIFRCNARTKEAKLQVSLAEIPLLR